MSELSREIRRLALYEELAGDLYDLAEVDGATIARVGNVTISLPEWMAPKLRPLLGSMVGILRTDIRGKEFLIRVLPEEKPDHEKESAPPRRNEMCRLDVADINPDGGGD